MKATNIIILALFMFFGLNIFAQVAINNDGSESDSSAMLDVKSTNRGFLPPRMTQSERNQITKPVPGLIIFCTDCIEMQMYNGTEWVNIDGSPASSPPNQAPVASDVTFSGTLEVGETLTGSYTYSDNEGDIEGTSTFQWYSADDALGTNQTPIIGATNNNYTLQEAYDTKYIAFEVEPVAQTGTSPGVSVLSSYQGAITTNQAPIASNVTFTGTLEVSETLTGSYTYSDNEGDIEGTTTFQWYSADDALGTNQTPIISATNNNYTLQEADDSKYIAFGVEPVAQTGTSPGVSVLSSYQGAITTNQAPIASDVTFTGTLAVGATLTGSYIYSDNEGDIEGTSTFQWYRADNHSGTNQTLIIGATYNNYTLQEADNGKSIAFEVEPVAQTGTSPGISVLSSYQGAITTNQAPVASDVTFSGTLEVGEILNGSYTYSDNESDIEGTSIYQWYRADNPSGTNQTLIIGATNNNYTLQEADNGKYIAFEVEPVAQTGTSPGISVLSSYQGAITTNQTPVASDVSFTGTLEVGETLTGSYTYSDNESDLEGTSIYQWYRADDASGTNQTLIIDATNNNYTLQEADDSKYIAFEVEPVAQTGTSPGISVLSSYQGPIIPNLPPVASDVSFTGTLEVGETLTGSYTYSDNESDLEGTSIYQWYRADDASGTNQTLIIDATNNNYTLQEADNGKYIAFEVEPVAQTGTSPGISVLSSYQGAIIPNLAPVASDVSFTGTLEVGEILNGSYTYSDNEGDIEGTSTFQWYSADDASGTNQTPIIGATNTNYTLQEAYDSKYIAFEVEPVAQTGTSPGVSVLSSYQGAITTNQAPIASDVTFTGTLEVGETLTGSYTYSDNEGDIEGTSTFQWYSADDASGTNQTPIIGATNNNYTLQEADDSKYIAFGVEPVAQTGTSPGISVLSLYQGVIITPWACGDSIVDSRDNKSYSTVLIGTQCWMAESINIGTMVNGIDEQTDNSTIEKYCYNDEEDSCSVYGGLYQWNEMMQYVTTSGTQGICPDGWHLPSDDEWKIMEMTLGLTQTEADNIGYRGTDEGGKMKETGLVHWNVPNTGATNSSGFNSLAAGIRETNGSFNYIGDYNNLWTTTDILEVNAYRRGLYTNSAEVFRISNNKDTGLSVRCLKD